MNLINCMLFFKLQAPRATKLVILSHEIMKSSSAILLNSSFWAGGLEPWIFEPVEINPDDGKLFSNEICPDYTTIQQWRTYFLTWWQSIKNNILITIICDESRVLNDWKNKNPCKSKCVPIMQPHKSLILIFVSYKVFSVALHRYRKKKIMMI